MSIFTKLFKWLSGAAKSVEHEAAKVAVWITEAIKTSIANGSLDIIAQIIDALTKSGVAEVVVAKVKVVLPNVMSIALGLQAPPDEATAEQIAEWEQNVLKAFGVDSEASKLYTTLAADLAKHIQVELAANNDKLSFAQWVIICEETYEDLKNYKAKEA